MDKCAKIEQFLLEAAELVNKNTQSEIASTWLIYSFVTFIVGCILGFLFYKNFFD
jgi:hypothetical protein